MCHLSHTTLYGPLTPCYVSEKTNEPTDGWTDGRMDGRTDGQTLFHKALLAKAGVLKSSLKLKLLTITLSNAQREILKFREFLHKSLMKN